MEKEEKKSDVICPTHKEDYSFVCIKCKKFLCNECIIDHDEDKHEAKYFPIIQYATKYALPRCADLIAHTGDEAKTLGEESKAYFSNLRKAKESLDMLKKKLEKTIALINEVSDHLDLPMDKGKPTDWSQSSVIKLIQEEVQACIEAKDIGRLCELCHKIDTYEPFKGVGDEDSMILAALVGLLETAIANKDLDNLSPLLTQFGTSVTKVKEKVLHIPPRLVWFNKQPIFTQVLDKANFTFTSATRITGHFRVWIKIHQLTANNYCTIGIVPHFINANRIYIGQAKVPGEYAFIGSGYYCATDVENQAGSPIYQQGDTISIAYNNAGQLTLSVNDGEEFVGFSDLAIENCYLAATLVDKGDELEIIKFQKL